MKKSNKILLAGFLGLLLLVSAIHISLYAKYKSGDYTIYQEEDNRLSQSMQAFPNILFVSVRNVQHATVRFDDVAQGETTDAGNIQYVQRGDTLLISSKDSTNDQGFVVPVSFHVPHNATLSLFNSALTFQTGKKIAGINPVIYLDNSRAVFSDNENPIQLGNVRLFASNSSVALFRENTQVNQLDVQLANSVFEYGDGKVGQLTIATDSLSHISLPAKHLINATIKNNTTQ
jgi:hypothetical protein